MLALAQYVTNIKRSRARIRRDEFLQPRLLKQKIEHLTSLDQELYSSVSSLRWIYHSLTLRITIPPSVPNRSDIKYSTLVSEPAKTRILYTYAGCPPATHFLGGYSGRPSISSSSNQDTNRFDDIGVCHQGFAEGRSSVERQTKCFFF